VLGYDSEEDISENPPDAKKPPDEQPNASEAAAVGPDQAPMMVEAMAEAAPLPRAGGDLRGTLDE